MFLHEDDFASVGHRAALKWFLQKLESRFEIKTSVIGTGVGEVREARVLNRILRITERGWDYEPDQRHAEIIVEQLGLKDARQSKRPQRRRQRWFVTTESLRNAGRSHELAGGGPKRDEEFGFRQRSVQSVSLYTPK